MGIKMRRKEMNNKLWNNSNGGFSLVEMLVALVISGIILTALALLITQSTKSYSRQTTLAQLQNEADITLNQVEINVFESSIINIAKTSAGLSFYTQTVGDVPSGYVYDKNDETLYYVEGGTRSLVCKDVTDFDVRINEISVDFDNMTILEIHPNVEVNVSIKLARNKYEREVERSFTTRNNLSEKLMLGAIARTEDPDDTEDLTGYLKSGDTISREQYLSYFKEN